MGKQRAERGYHPGLFEVPDQGHAASAEELFRYWHWFRSNEWKVAQGRKARSEGSPLHYHKEDWRLKVPLEYLT